MNETPSDWLALAGLQLSPFATLIVTLGVMLLLLALLHGVLHYGVLRMLRGRMRNDRFLFIKLVGHSSLFRYAAMLMQGLALGLLTRLWVPLGSVHEGLLGFSRIWMLVYTILAAFAFLDIVLDWCFRKQVAVQFPLKGIVQSLKIIAAITGVIFIVSVLIGQSPVILISGLGAMTAVIMLIFKDPILGLVAGIQLSANNMLSIGDWLEMPKYNADGAVIDIGLTTVKVRNWDNTVTTIPTYSLISDSFKNWRAMSESGGRRIKRAIHIDVNSIKFITESQMLHLTKSRLLSQYILDKSREVEDYNQSRSEDLSSALNGRRLTNIGTFRAYLEVYLRNHPHIHRNMTLLVRQLAPGATGVPIEIYAFTTTVVWAEYERIQSDLFDHIFAVVGEFDLRVFQEPSGYDMAALKPAIAGNLNTNIDNNGNTSDGACAAQPNS
ncbi:mechanosensitive ion channel family protein [Advenella kashmirensis]